jgi:hypothetical protein
MNERCFLLRRKDGCGALSVKICPGLGRCSFFRTRWAHEEDLEAANARLRALPEQVQQDIAWGYYKGRMPWRENER